MARPRQLNVISFEQLKTQMVQAFPESSYDPSWDQTRGVIRLPRQLSDELAVERGDFIKVSHRGARATYTCKVSPALDAGTIALDYDQQRQLKLHDRKGPATIRIRRGRKSAIFSYLWKHVDPGIRFPFRISIWMAIVGALAGSAVASAVERSYAALARLF
jgi:hypothetical protein